MVYDAKTTASRARSSGTWQPPGMCLQWTRTMAGVGAVYPDAATAWANAKKKHPGDRKPPEGAPTWYTGGSQGYGHACVSMGGGMMRSTDAGGAGRNATVDIGWPERAWGMRYAGWSEDINGVTVPGLSGAPAPKPPPEGEDMPEYVRATAKARSLGDGWQAITWDAVPADSTGKATKAGEAGLRIPGKRYVATLAAQVSIPSGVVRTRPTEGDASSGAWKTVETSQAREHPATSGDTYLVDTRAGSCRAGDAMRLRWEINASGSRLVAAEVQLVYW